MNISKSSDVRTFAELLAGITDKEGLQSHEVTFFSRDPATAIALAAFVAKTRGKPGYFPRSKLNGKERPSADKVRNAWASIQGNVALEIQVEPSELVDEDPPPPQPLATCRTAPRPTPEAAAALTARRTTRRTRLTRTISPTPPPSTAAPRATHLPPPARQAVGPAAKAATLAPPAEPPPPARPPPPFFAPLLWISKQPSGA